MSYVSQATLYRENEVLSASPGQLVVMLYDHLLVNLRRVRITVHAGNVEVRNTLLDKARLVVSELLSTLDAEKGGTIAVDLASLYTFLLGELIDQGIRPDAAKLDRLIGIVTELREAFAGAAGLAADPS